MPLHILSCLVVLGHFQHSNDLQLEMVWGGIVQNRVILLWTNASSYALAHNYCYCHAYLSSSRYNFCLLWCHLRQKKIWKIIRRRGLAVWWKCHTHQPIHINSSQLLCACQGTFNNHFEGNVINLEYVSWEMEGVLQRNRHIVHVVLNIWNGWSWWQTTKLLNS